MDVVAQGSVLCNGKSVATATKLSQGEMRRFCSIELEELETLTITQDTQYR